MWFKVDDAFYDHPKVARLSMAARGLWVTCGSYCARHMTDGHISRKQVRQLGGTAVQVRDLIAIGMWIECESHCNCIVFHDWIDMQPTRESEAIRKANMTERKRRSRRQNGSDQGEHGNVTRDRGVTDAESVTRDPRGRARATRVDPTRPEKEETTSLLPPTPHDDGRPDPADPPPRGASSSAIVPRAVDRLVALSGTSHSPAAHRLALAHRDAVGPISGGELAKIAVAVDQCLASGAGDEQIAAGLQAWSASDSWAASQIPAFVAKAAARSRAAPVGKPSRKAATIVDAGERLIAEMGLT